MNINTEFTSKHKPLVRLKNRSDFTRKHLEKNILMGRWTQDEGESEWQEEKKNRVTSSYTSQ